MPPGAAPYLAPGSSATDDSVWVDGQALPWSSTNNPTLGPLDPLSLMTMTEGGEGWVGQGSPLGQDASRGSTPHPGPRSSGSYADDSVWV